MPRPKNFKVSRKARRAIAAARTGKKWSAETMDAIGEGVRKGSTNKVPFNTRISEDADSTIRSKATSRGLPLAQAVEKAFLDW